MTQILIIQNSNNEIHERGLYTNSRQVRMKKKITSDLAFLCIETFEIGGLVY